MPIASTIFPDNDGVVYKFSTDTWANNRKATSGTLNTTSSYYVQNSHTSGRGGDTYQIGRYFLEFDTSNINNTLSHASLNIYGNSLGTLDVILLKSDQTGAISTADYNNIDGAAFPLGVSNGAGAGTMNIAAVTIYANEVTTWSTSGYNDITLNAQALADMRDDSTVYIALVNFDYDLKDVEPTDATGRNGLYYTNYTGTSRDPYIDYTLATVTTDNSIFFGTNF